MIIREFYMTRKDGVNLYKTYSDKNVYIIKQGTDEKYEEAIYVENTNYTYEETEEIIDHGTRPDVEENDAGPLL